MTRATALVTGASSGLGLELARCFGRDGHDLVLVARSGAPMHELADELEERYEVTTHAIPKDLAKPVAARELAAELDALKVEVDALVNCAGFTQFARFAEGDEHEMLELLNLNVIALTHITRLLLPGMIARGRGTIINMASNAAFQPGPLMACYYASKAYVLSFSLAIAEELRDSGVSVTALCPGPTRTGFQARGEMEDSKLVSGRQLATAAEVAEWGYAQAKKGRPFAVHGARWQTAAFATRLMPRPFAARLALWAQERAGS